MTTLRERKKARTKTAIQRHALRLFAEQGYHATTVEQVAEAAEVAASTVFRYFPTKDDLAVLDDYYPLSDTLTRALAEQPPELGPIEAFRGALRVMFDGLSPDERAARYERDLLMVTVPELWGANIGLIDRARRTLSEQLAARAPDGTARVVVDALVGVCLIVLFDWARDQRGDPAAALDDALARLADGLTSGR